MVRNRKQIAGILAITLIIGFQMSDCMSQAISVSESQPLPTDPPRVKIIQTINGSTIGTADGQRLRGVPMAYETSDVTNPFNTKVFNPDFYRKAHNLGFNAIRCFVENPDLTDQAKVNASLAVLDTIVNLASKYGMQLMLNAGNIGYYRNPSPEELTRLIEYNKTLNTILAKRYKNRTHVIFEQQNEPFYDNAFSYPTIVQDIADCYNIIRAEAPDSHISLFTFMISCGYSMVDMARSLDTKTTIDWTKTSVAYHGYGPPCKNIDRILEVMADYPVVETEFWPEKGLGEGGFGTPYEMEGLERNEISWFTWWLHNGVTDLSIYEPMLADLVTAGVMWDFIPIDLQEPVVNVGKDTTIFLPDNSLSLTGDVSDPNGSIVKYNWVLVKSTGQANVSQNGATVELTNMTQGVYHLRLYAWDNEGNYMYDGLQVVVGKLQTIPGTVQAEDYSGSFGIDGSNFVGWIDVGDWTEYKVNIAEEGLYSIEVSSAADIGYGGTGYFLLDGTKVSSVFVAAPTGGWGTYKGAFCTAYLPAGLHTLRFEPIKAGGYNLDWYSITKTTATFEVTTDHTIKLPVNSVDLTVNATDPSGIASYEWTMIQGKTGSILTGTDTNVLTAGNLIVGDYIFNVTVTTNNNQILVGTVMVSVLPCEDNPSVFAGADKKFALPKNSVDITAMANSGSGIVSYTWEKLSGPDVIMANSNTETISLSNLVAGFYNFRITVVSTNGCVAWDEVMVKVFTPVGIENAISDEESLVIYPNPVKTELIIERKTWIGNEAIVTLRNTKGQVLKQAPWITNILIWSVEEYSKGVYFISIFEKGKITHKKLVIE